MTGAAAAVSAMVAGAGGGAGDTGIVKNTTTAGAWSYTPNFTGTVSVRLKGPGGNGSTGYYDWMTGAGYPGVGAGAGAHVVKVISVTNGVAISGVIGSPGSATATTLTVGGTLSAGAGGNASAYVNGTGGTATGGDTNENGLAGGADGNPQDGGGCGPDFAYATDAFDFTVIPGQGGPGLVFSGRGGQVGLVEITRLT